MFYCHDPSLRLTTKVEAWKSVGQKCNPGVTLHSWECEGMNPHAPKWTLTLGVGIPLGVLQIQKNISGVKAQWMKKLFT
jgi:hypothetical protein